MRSTGRNCKLLEGTWGETTAKRKEPVLRMVIHSANSTDTVGTHAGDPQ
jgi:hypothetical protein